MDSPTAVLARVGQGGGNGIIVVAARTMPKKMPQGGTPRLGFGGSDRGSLRMCRQATILDL